MPLSYRKSDRSAKNFLDTAGRGFWEQRLDTFYEGEVDCETGIPSGYGRLFVQDGDQGRVHHYIGFFDDSHIPLFYQGDKVKVGDISAAAHRDYVYHQDKFVSDGSNTSGWNSNRLNFENRSQVSVTEQTFICMEGIDLINLEEVDPRYGRYGYAAEFSRGDCQLYWDDPDFSADAFKLFAPY